MVDMFRALFSYIHRQPKAMRTNYAFILASLFTGVVTLVWLSVHSKTGFLIKSGNQAEQVSDRPFSNLFDQAKEQMAAVRGAVGDTKDALVNEATTTLQAQNMVLEQSTINETNAKQAETPSVVTTPSATPTTTEPIYREIQISPVRATGTASATAATGAE